MATAALADTAGDTSRGRTQNDAPIIGPTVDDVAGGGVAVVTDVAADGLVVTAGMDADTDTVPGDVGPTAMAAGASAAAGSRKRSRIVTAKPSQIPWEYKKG